MKVLSLWQPWASLVACGVKTIETRSWPTKHRGPLAIHAARSQKGAGMASECWDALRAEFDADYDYPLGAIVATCTLVDCAPMIDLLTGEPDSLLGRSPALYLEPDGVLTISHHFEVPARHIDVSDQRPYGDFAPGRWAWLLNDITPIDPVPFKGGQGLTKELNPK